MEISLGGELHTQKLRQEVRACLARQDLHRTELKKEDVMEFITGVIAWFTANWAQIVEAYLMLIGAASIIVKLTPTLKDDDVLKWLVKFLGKYIVLNRGSTTT